MTHRKALLSCAAALLALLILLPSVQSADPVEGVKAKIAPALGVQLSAAQPNDYVTAIVKMNTVANLKPIRGDRKAVFSELRAVSRNTQNGLVQYLGTSAVKPKVKLIRQFWIDNIVLVQATPDVIREIAARPDVRQVFDNYTVTMPPRPGDGSRATLQQSAPLWDALGKIGAKQVWSTYGLNGTGVRVGGLDTGVDITHPDIAGKMITNNPADPTYPGGWAEFNSTGGLVPGSLPRDTDQHGTHTTGTAIGGSASGYPIGVAPGAHFMHGLVIPGGSGTFAQVAGGMQWIIDPDGNPATNDGAQVVNMSLGGTGTYSEMVAPTDNMVAANVFPSFSIGNSGPNASTTGSPGNVPSAYGVGATDSLDVIAYFSSRGPVTWNFPPYVGTWIKPDISAPGVDIFSSIPGGGYEGDWDGTSMAAPHVTGTVALMLQANPTLTVEQTKLLLQQTAVDRGDPGMDNIYGWGRVNAFAAVSAALTGIGTLEGHVYSSVGGLPVEGAKVRLTDTGQQVYTNAAGYYMLKAVAGTHTVQVSRFGYDAVTVTVDVAADATTVQDFTLMQLPSGTIAGYVTDEETGVGIAASIVVKYLGDPVLTVSTNPADGYYSVTLPTGTYDLVFSPSFPYPKTTRNGVAVYEGMTTTLDVSLGRAQILIVDDDAGKEYQTYFETAVAGAGRSYLTVAAPPNAATMALFESVVWLTGNDYSTTLTTTDMTEIAAYLDGGGRLFMTGQDIGYDVGTTPFYTNYLHASYVQDDVGLGGVLGVAASAVGNGFTFEIKGGSGANNQAYPSEINVVAPAAAAFVYDPAVPAAAATANDATKNDVSANAITSSGTAGLTFENGTYKLVYFAFGFEAVADATTRTLLMDRVLDWLQGYPKIAHTPLGDTEDAANPYRVSAVVTSDYFALDPSSIVLVYDAGAGDVTVPMTAAGGDVYEASIPAQTIGTEVAYYITASDVEGHVTTHPMGAPTARHVFRVMWDTEDPVVMHLKHSNTNDLAGPYHIYAGVTDNIGVESVYLMWAANGGTAHRQRMELLPDGRYHGAIPGPTVVGDYFDYWIYAMDEAYAGNVTRMPSTGAYHFEIVEYFLWDFEPDDGGFAQTGNVWEWGMPTTGPGAAHSGVNLWATKLATTYPASSNAKLDAPEITIAASKPYTILSFWHWYEMESAYDGGNVKVSADGGATWSLVTPVGGYDGTARTTNAGIPGELCFTGTNNMFWQQEMFDLSAYVGQSIKVRFHFGSDPSVHKAGWYVDDVMIRSTDTDDYAPTISGTTVPGSTFDTAGPYTVTTHVNDILSGVGAVSLFYTTDNGFTFTEVPMTHGAGDLYSGAIPGQPSGARIKFYVKAVDSSAEANETVDPALAPAMLYSFGIMPSSDILVVVSGSTSGTSLAMFQEALTTAGYDADYWNRTTQGWLATDKLLLYKYIFVDETSGLTAAQMTGLQTYLAAGTQGAKKRLVLMGRDLGYNSTTRPWLEQYLRVNYVQDNPGYREITGYPGDPIGAGETFVISGSYPDEWQRSTVWPGGEIVYQYTGAGTATNREELQGEYEKEGKEWDGVVPNTPISLDAAAAIKYNAPNYRSVAFAFNLYYILQADRRAAVMGRTIAWLSAPDILHAPLHDTEDVDNPYPVAAKIYSETLDPTRLYMTYDLGSGPVAVLMAPTGVPDEYVANIPAQPNGTMVQYYLSAANLDGTTSYHPSGAPADKHVFRVTTDITPPEIVHAPIGNSADIVGPYLVTATITDNIGVNPAGVFLSYNKNGGAVATVAMAAMGGDVYQASIPGPAVVGDVFNYYITARDLASVPNVGRNPAAGYHTFMIVDYYAWDFEASGGDFAAAGTDWEWGAPSYASGPPAAHSGTKLWGTKLAATYSASSNSRLETPTVTVPTSAPYATLTFWQWYANETNYDGGNVKISTDGGATWTLLNGDVAYNGTSKSTTAGIPLESIWTGTATGNFWNKVTVNLTAYRGQPVKIRFHFGADGSFQYAGWYVDDVMIAGVPADADPPVFVSTTVPSSTWDTVGPYVVKTKVRDGLAGLASVTMYYSVDNGVSWTTVAMTPTGVADEFGGNIPGQPARTRIKLYLAAADNAANTALNPAGAPASTYQFGIMPSGDYLVILGGSAPSPASSFTDAFTAIGKTCDTWNWDTQGVPTLAMLNAYVGVIVDESSYFDTAQLALLTSYLDQNDGSKQRIVFWGRDLSYGSGSPRTFMEKYTGMAYVKDDPGTTYRWLWSTPGDPIGNGERFAIVGTYPDELKLSTLYPGAQIIYKYHLSSTTAVGNIGSEEELLAYYYKEGKEYDGVWPMIPAAPDSAAAGRYVGTYHASVYFAFQFSYVTDPAIRANVLDRSLNWLTTVTTTLGETAAKESKTPEIPDRLTMSQNYPNPFNPVTTIQVGVPANFSGAAELRIYNVKGELVRTLHQGAIKPGVHTFRWEGTNDGGRKVTSGIYFYRFVCGTERITKKMVLLR